MAITFDPFKRDRALRERGLDFADAEEVFQSATVDHEDVRKDYGETRMVSIGVLKGRMVVLGWTQRGSDRHVFSMRKANEREQKKFGQRLLSDRSS